MALGEALIESGLALRLEIKSVFCFWSTVIAD